MTEIVFGVVIITLIVAFAFYVVENNKERDRLINAIVAKTPEQLRDLNMADKVKIHATVPMADQQPDLTPLENVSEEEFDEHIKAQLK